MFSNSSNRAAKQKKLGCGGSAGGMKYLLLRLGHQSKIALVLEDSQCGNGCIWL